MSNRDYEGQPLTGDAALVRTKAQHYQEIGHAITRSLNTIDRLADADDQRSKAVEALRGSLSDVSRDIGKAQQRYALTATALLDYSTKLKQAQDDADTAISEINAARSALDTAESTQRRADRAADEPDADAAAQTAAQTAADEVSRKRTAVSTAVQKWHAAKGDKDSAAQAASRDINDVVNGKVGDQLNDSWWDDIGKIRDVLKIICEIAGVLAIFLSWVPILGAVLVGLAILGAIMAMIDAVVKLTRGEGGIMDVVFAAVGLVLAAFGGKIFSYLGKLAKFKAMNKVMTKGDDFLNSKAFKKVFGASKNSFKSGEYRNLFKNGNSFKTFLSDGLNPFKLGLGKGSTFSARFSDGFATGWQNFRGNPLGLKTLDLDLTGDAWKALSRGGQVTLMLVDGRKVLGTGQTLINTLTPLEVSLKPDSILKDISVGIENRITER
ncbi:hypothetical protein [Ruicaihuangia caeni]|uniref:hypothetical protein n=1 Tax=Ruicaihuangia caeni TaxID=3042517 RepID=UPI00338FCC6A